MNYFYTLSIQMKKSHKFLLYEQSDYIECYLNRFIYKQSFVATLVSANENLPLP